MRHYAATARILVSVPVRTSPARNPTADRPSQLELQPMLFPRPASLSRGLHTAACPIFTSSTFTIRSQCLNLRFYGRSQGGIQQARYASILGSLHNINDSYKKRIRRGRGPSSGKGKTSGRGHKGQGQHGGVPDGFEGGQTPVAITHGLPRGFVNQHQQVMTPLNLNRLQEWIDAGRIDPSKPITFKELVETRCIHGIKDGVKLLVKSLTSPDVKFTTPIDITVSRASTAAIKLIEEVGGKVTTRFFNKQGVLQTAYPHHFPHNPRLADATHRKELEYYRNPVNRGYLSHLVEPGQNPASLFFKDPKTEGKKRKQTKKKSDRLF